MKSNNLAIIVPVDNTEDAENLKTQVWAAVTAKLTKYLGRFYGSFSPLRKAWDCTIKDEFGVVLGREKPLDFMELFAEAHELQRQSADFHAKQLVGEILKHDLTGPVVPIVINRDNMGMLLHASWHLLARDGTVLPDLGVFYAEQDRAIISEEEEMKVLSHVADYAICMVQVNMEGADA